jgi:TRAP-type C4-dicarboxylate transport system permease large subunit
MARIVFSPLRAVAAGTPAAAVSRYQQTTPVSSVLMVASSIAKSSVWDVTRANVWFIGVLLVVLMLVTYVPVTGMGLVEAFYR